MSSKPDPARHRALCLRCFRSQSTCYCQDVKPFRSAIELVLLQHPLERKRTIGTARMTHLCIENSRLIAGAQFGGDEQVNRILSDSESYCTILFPGSNSRNLSLESPEAVRAWFPPGKRLVIFVIDGTWACARSMVRRSPNLAALPQICFTPDQSSEYQFRRQPHPHCLSTLEAVHRILQILDPSESAEILLRLFRDMVKRQLSYRR